MKALKIILVIVICFAVVFLVAYLSSDGTAPNNGTNIAAPAPGNYNAPPPPPNVPTPPKQENEDAELIRKMKINP